MSLDSLLSLGRVRRGLLITGGGSPMDLGPKRSVQRRPQRGNWADLIRARARTDPPFFFFLSLQGLSGAGLCVGRAFLRLQAAAGKTTGQAKFPCFMLLHCCACVRSPHLFFSLQTFFASSRRVSCFSGRPRPSASPTSTSTGSTPSAPFSFPFFFNRKPSFASFLPTILLFSTTACCLALLLSLLPILAPSADRSELRNTRAGSAAPYHLPFPNI